MTTCELLSILPYKIQYIKKVFYFKFVEYWIQDDNSGKMFTPNLLYSLIILKYINSLSVDLNLSPNRLGSTV